LLRAEFVSLAELAQYRPVELAQHALECLALLGMQNRNGFIARSAFRVAIDDAAE
jgi:hypothetical protein